jgi:hypothetical protein
VKLLNKDGYRSDLLERSDRLNKFREQKKEASCPSFLSGIQNRELSLVRRNYLYNAKINTGLSGRTILLSR